MNFTQPINYTDIFVLELSIANISKLQWNFPDLSGNIPAGNQLTAIEMTTATYMLLAPSGQVPIADAIMKNAIITIVDTDQKKKIMIAGYDAVPYLNNGVRFQIPKPFDTNWQGCYVVFAPGTVPTINTSIVLTLFSAPKF